MVYSDFKDLPQRTASNKVLHNKTFKIAIMQKNNGYHSRPASMVYNFFDKMSDDVRIKHKVEIIYNTLMNYIKQ